MEEKMKYSKLMANLYHYSGDEKREISGFSKFEIQGDIVRITLKLCFLKFDNGTIRVYLLSEENGIVYAHKLKEDKMRQRIFTMQRAFDLNELKKNNINVDGIKGVYINFNDKKYFMSIWENEVVDIKKIKITEGNSSNEKISKSQEPEKRRTELIIDNRKAQEETETVIDINKAQEEETEAVIKNEKAQEETEAVIKNEEAREETEAVISNEKAREETEVVAGNEKVQDKISDAASGPDRQSASVTAQQENLQFEKTDLIMLKSLPQKAWALGNNSFLLHGYYNYHYIVIRKEDSSWIVGVPGIYHPKEEKIAAYFGFDSFCPELNEEIKNNVFGYWCMSVDISE